MTKSDINYYNTLITIAPDSSAQQGAVPTSRGESKTVAQLQYELLSKHPYEKTQEDVLFEVYAQRKLPGVRMNSSQWKEARTEFFSKSQACLRTSPLAKQFGWGLHFDEKGRIALVGCETPQYAQLFQEKPGGLKVVAAMRSKRG